MRVSVWVLSMRYFLEHRVERSWHLHDRAYMSLSLESSAFDYERLLMDIDNDEKR